MLVSAVIPAHNAEATIGEAIESALTQPQCNEVIVVDDGSADRTPQVVSGFGDRVRLVSQENKGVAAARNVGLAQAGGRYVGFLDADDVWCEGKIEAQLRALESHPAAGVCFTGAYRVDSRLKVLDEIHAHVPEDMTAALLWKCAVAGSASSVIARRELCLQAGGFDESLSQCADWDFWLRLSRVTGFVAVSRPLVLIRVHGSNMSRNVRGLERDSLAMLDHFFATPEARPYRPSRRRVLGHNWSVLSGSYLAAGDVQAALRCLGRALSHDPRSAARGLSLPVRRLRRRLARR